MFVNTPVWNAVVVIIIIIIIIIFKFYRPSVSMIPKDLETKN